MEYPYAHDGRQVNSLVMGRPWAGVGAGKVLCEKLPLEARWARGEIPLPDTFTPLPPAVRAPGEPITDEILLSEVFPTPVPLAELPTPTPLPAVQVRGPAAETPLAPASSLDAIRAAPAPAPTPFAAALASADAMPAAGSPPLSVLSPGVLRLTPAAPLAPWPGEAAGETPGVETPIPQAALPRRKVAIGIVAGLALGATAALAAWAFLAPRPATTTAAPPATSGEVQLVPGARPEGSATPLDPEPKPPETEALPPSTTSRPVAADPSPPLSSTTERHAQSSARTSKTPAPAPSARLPTPSPRGAVENETVRQRTKQCEKAGDCEE